MIPSGLTPPLTTPPLTLPSPPKGERGSKRGERG